MFDRIDDMYNYDSVFHDCAI